MVTIKVTFTIILKLDTALFRTRDSRRKHRNFRVAGLFQETTDEVPLILFPCVNGILHEGGKVLNHCGEPDIIRSLRLV